MAERSLDCICAGIVVADHVCEPVDHLPEPGELVLSRRLELTVGGCASNAALDLAKLGARVAVVGRVGDDVFGRFVREKLQTAGVCCDFLAESTTRETSGTLVINTQGEDRRFIHSTGANEEFSGREVTREQTRGCRVLYLGGYGLSETLSPENVAAMFQQARAAGATTMLDVVVADAANCRRMLEPVLPFTDVFLPNDDEARLLTGCDDPFAQAEAFQHAGARTVVITRGEKGAVLLGSEGKLRAGSYPVDYVDGTGSGDAFVAGYIYALLQQRDVVDCLRFGSALGASCVRAAGATTGTFTADELEAFVASQPPNIERL